MPNSENIADILGLPDHMKISQVDPKNSNSTKGQKSYTVAVNPSSYSVDHSVALTNDQVIGDHTSTYSFNKVNAKNLNITLLFDSTGSLPQTSKIQQKSVLEQINAFLSVAYYRDPKKKNNSSTKMLRLIWGKMIYEGTLTNASITYSHFDSIGVPIRAKAICSFTGGKIKFEQPDEVDQSVQRNTAPQKTKINVEEEKHGINAVQQQGDYLAILSGLPKESMPKSLRVNSEIAKINV